MTRPLRLEFPGALFHVTTRGNAKQNIFLDDVDRVRFLEMLAACVKRCDWILPAYVLMTNHYHLVLQLTCESLSLGLQWLNGEYVKYFNRRHNRVGHLFQGRPDTPLVDKQNYYLNVVRYAVLNPVRANMVATPEDYRWSSHRALIGLEPVPEWLAADNVLVQFAPEVDLARARYRTFVNAGIGVDDNPWDNLVGQVYLGRDEWLTEVREKVELKPRCDEHPLEQRTVGTLPMATIISVVANTLSIPAEDVRRRQQPRELAAWIGWNEALLTNRQIAAGLRVRGESTVSRIVREADRDIGASAGLQECLDRCLATIRGNRGRRQA